MLYEKYVEILDSELLAEIAPTAPNVEAIIEVEFELYGNPVDYNTTEVWGVELTGFFIDGKVVEISVSDVINAKIIAMLDLADPDFILELEESTYCGMDY